MKRKAKKRKPRNEAALANARLGACQVCGKRGCDPHHVKTRAAGGSDDPSNLMSLCRKHHTECHTIGVKTFMEKYDLSGPGLTELIPIDRRLTLDPKLSGPMETVDVAKSVGLVAVDELKPNPINPNRHSLEQIKATAKLIEHYGWRHPIIVSNQSGLVVVGHCRLEAAKLLGLKTVPVQYQDFKSADDEFGFLVADNGSSQWAELDFAAINLELPNLGPDFDLDWLGLKDFVVEPADKQGLIPDDEVPEAKESICKTGDLWQLGEHRLLCGDCTVKENVEQLMGGEKADMVYCDPPYGMNLDTDYTAMNGVLRDGSYIERNKHSIVIGDTDDFKPELITSILANFDYVEEVFLWGGDYYAELLPNRNDGSWVVWDKTGTEDRDKGFGSSWELCWSKSKHKRTFARIWWQGIFGVKDDSRNRCHPTQKPVQLSEWFFDRWGKDKTNIVDLYLGSGSTLIACQKTGRRCFGMEIDEHYCDVIISRFEAFTGIKAVKL